MPAEKKQRGRLVICRLRCVEDDRSTHTLPDLPTLIHSRFHRPQHWSVGEEALQNLEAWLQSRPFFRKHRYFARFSDAGSRRKRCGRFALTVGAPTLSKVLNHVSHGALLVEETGEVRRQVADVRGFPSRARPIREMGGAPRNLAPRNHLLAWIVKPSGRHCTDGHLTSRVFTKE